LGEAREIQDSLTTIVETAWAMDSSRRSGAGLTG
jgi:hypothetical protein